MKILVLQLARLGDIYQTWPTLKALKRQGAEVHLVTRAKFAVAAPGPDVIDHHFILDTNDLLSPLVTEAPDVEFSLEKLEDFCDQLRAENYDRVINLTFSAFSSYLTKEVAGVLAEVQGYSRFSDGYLNIPDDGSAYFYAQVGVGKSNRLHVSDLFAYVAGVELTEADWQLPAAPANADGEEVVLIHVGASHAGKTLSAPKWQQIAKGLCESSWKGSVVLIGSAEEKEVAAQIAAVSSERKPLNLVGQTSVQELFTIVSQAKLMVGGDSGPIQIASLTGTPVLNISLPIVSFWETGPRSKGSRILPIADEGEVSAGEIVNEILSMLKGDVPRLPVVRVPGPTIPYVETKPQPRAFEWELIRAMYMGGEFPVAPSELFELAIQRLNEVNSLAMEQIESLRRIPGNKTAASILERADEIMDQIVGMVPEVSPLVQWFRVERTRIGPMPVAQVIEATDQVHRRLADVVRVYLVTDGEGAGHDDVQLG